MKKFITNLEWYNDNLGSYWVADLFARGKKVGVTGTYYSLDKNGNRLSKEEQEKELKDKFIVMRKLAPTNTG